MALSWSIQSSDEEEAVSLGGGGCFAFMFTNDHEKTNSACVWSGWKSISGAYNKSEIFKARELASVAALNVYLAMKKSIDAMGTQAYNTDTPAPSFNKVIEHKTMVKDDSDDDRMEI